MQEDAGTTGGGSTCDLTSSQDDVCPICLDVVSTNACHLECGHTFHSACILQSVMHDARCPVCRVSVAQAPAARQTQTSGGAVDLGDDTATATTIQREYEATRRRQIRFDRKRRALISRATHLQRPVVQAKVLDSEVKALDAQIKKSWAKACASVWKQDQFVDLRRERALLKRRLQHRQHVINTYVSDHLGARPEIEIDYDELILARAITYYSDQTTTEQ